MVYVAKAIQKISPAADRKKRRSGGAAAAAVTRVEVQTSKALGVRKRISGQNRQAKTYTGTVRYIVRLPGATGMPSVFTPDLSKLSTFVCAAAQGQLYTWRDCEVLLQALYAEPRDLPALQQAAKAYAVRVKSDV